MPSGVLEGAVLTLWLDQNKGEGQNFKKLKDMQSTAQARHPVQLGVWNAGYKDTMGNKHTGRLELTWTDKDKTLLSTGDGQYDYTFVHPSDYRVSEVRLLHEIERVEAPAPDGRPDGLPEPTDDNLLITGDAMHVLDVLVKMPEYADSSTPTEVTLLRSSSPSIRPT